MSLLTDSMEACVYLEKTRVPDGAGGTIVQWRDGSSFDAAIVLDTSTIARVAEADGARRLYRIYVRRGVSLDFHDVFRRVWDGKVFRVTSDPSDKKTPAVSSLDVSVAGAEEWELPT
jgi:hypothetical protein